MTATIPTMEPTTLRAGDTWRWRRDDLSADYPAPTWTLKYRFKNAAGGFEVEAVPDGVNFLVNELADDTQGRAAGAYNWQAQVDNGTERYTVGEGVLQVLPSLFAGAAGTGQDVRSWAARTLANVKDAIEKLSSKTVAEYEIDGRRWKGKDLAELMQFRAQLELEVGTEVPATAGRSRRNAYVRFSRNV